MKIKTELKDIKDCPHSFMLAINDTMNVLNGKWKLAIMASLFFGPKRFKDMQEEIPKITPRMLSKELRDLEINGIIKRDVYDSIPVKIEYEYTPSGKAFKNVLDAMIEWGLEHRKVTLKNKSKQVLANSR